MIAACLTGIMILIFLGSWRSTLIIAISIPLSILVSICVLSAIHQTINIMTLGGLALAVGILVDDATVEIENVNRNLEEGKETRQAILDGAAQIAVPALVSTLCICIVFLPDVFPERRGEVSVCAAGGSGGFRHAGVVFSFADAGAHDGAVSAEAAASRSCAHAQSVYAVAAGFRTRLRAAAAELSAHADDVRAPALDFHSAVSGRLPRAAFCCFRGSGRTFSRPATTASFGCISATRPEPASKKPRGSAIWWISPSGARFLRPNCKASWITWACRTAASIRRTTTRA